jgi:hypothetical protein
MPNIRNPIVAQKRQPRQSERRSQQNSPHRQLPLFDSPQPTRDYPLTIEKLPDALQWWDETRYLLIHKDSGLRVPGSFSEREARKIQEVSKDWDWSVDTRDRKVACGLNLLALAEGICQQSQQSKQGDKRKNAEAVFLTEGGEG